MRRVFFDIFLLVWIVAATVVFVIYYVLPHAAGKLG
jgi:hypothetical protein